MQRADQADREGASASRDSGLSRDVDLLPCVTLTEEHLLFTHHPKTNQCSRLCATSHIMTKIKVATLRAGHWGLDASCQRRCPEFGSYNPFPAALLGTSRPEVINLLLFFQQFFCQNENGISLARCLSQ